MEIDPMTHQPLNKVSRKSFHTYETSPKAGNVKISDYKSKEIDGGTMMNSIDESSTITHQDSSADDYELLGDDLFNILWTNDEPPLVDESWSNNNVDVGGSALGKNIFSAGEDFPTWPSEKKNVESWMFLDYCQDFGVQDFGFECYHDFGQSSTETGPKD
ncbi:unnamed protein product [Thlaspi arvense]|uniref:Uncharacterized protein n=1 Tax=Thlaspi arvense TaxID=13288 RepID=A0AAU9SRB0_THLAR|nr:unnamed protein product [Thlaspi arvense]